MIPPGKWALAHTRCLFSIGKPPHQTQTWGIWISVWRHCGLAPQSPNARRLKPAMRAFVCFFVLKEKDIVYLYDKKF
jgi:hypothetical protein